MKIFNPFSNLGGCLVVGIFGFVGIMIIGLFLEKYMIMANASKGAITTFFIISTIVLAVLYLLFNKHLFMFLQGLIVMPVVIFAYYSSFIHMINNDVLYLIYVYMAPVVSLGIGYLTGVFLILLRARVFHKNIAKKIE